MTIALKRSTASQPGRMESHPMHRTYAHPRCPLQELHPEDLRTMCDTIEHDDGRLPVRTDEESFSLHLQFVRAHGIPKGEVTILSSSCTPMPNGERD